MPRKMKWIRVALVALVVAGILAIAQHHHDDFDEHDDCPVCALVQDGAEFVDYTPQVVIVYKTLFILDTPTYNYVEMLRYNFYKPRAPPALST